jgi:ethanolamine ammonia-lyase small subunit
MSDETTDPTRPQTDLDAAQRKRLETIFGTEGPDLEEKLTSLAEAAVEEYALAFTGTRAPSTIRELRELRLQLLYKHFPAGEPTDDQVARLFQMTPAQVATLIAGTRARFEAELGSRLRSEAITTLTTKATRVDENTIRIVVSDSLARYLKDLVAQTSAPPIERRKDASRTYDVGRATVRALCRRLGLELDQVTTLDQKS